MKAVMITGGLGFVGAYTAAKFIEEGYKAILYDRRQIGVELLRGKSSQYQSVIGEVQDWRNVLNAVREYKVEGIIHCALPFTTHMAKDNIDACYNLLEVCRLEKLKFVYISSNAVYGYRPDPNPMVETDYVPILKGTALDEYAAMKVMCETLTTMYHSVYGVDSVSCRLSWVYGPRAVEPSLSSGAWYPEWFLSNAVAGIPSILDEGGDFTITYTYVKDVARGLFLAFTVRPLKHRLYNITGGKTISAREVVDTVKRIIPGANIGIGPGQMVKGLGNPKVHPIQLGSVLVTRAQEELGFTTTSLEQALRETAKWLKKQPKVFTTPEPHGSELKTE